MTQCVYCGNQVVWADVMATTVGQRVALTADSRGLLALEEREQYIHMGVVCAPCCGSPAPITSDDFEDGPECWSCGHRTVVLDESYWCPQCARSDDDCECECGVCGTVSSSYECPCCGAPLS